MLLHLGHHRMIIMMPLSLELSKYKLVLCLAKASCQSLIMSTVRTSALAYSIECCMFIYKTQTSIKKV